MRMRKKKNGDRRLNECGNIIIASRDELPELPVTLEIGCGKGGFICQMAQREPKKQFVCVEICSDVAVLAAEKVRSLGIGNVHFIVADAKTLPSFFNKGDVERIYLNFSDPWKKSGQYKRRLTYRSFLFMYKSIMQDGASVVFKTDNRPLFDFSLEEFKFAGFELRGVTNDLHASEFAADNVMTEYEKTFSARGFKINRLEAALPSEANVTARPMRADEIDRVMSFFADAREYMRSHGIDQWQDDGGYPSRDIVENDLAAGRAFVLETSGKTVAYAAFCRGIEPTYAEIDGSWLNDKPYAAVHRVAVADEYKGMGLAGVLFRHFESLCRSEGISDLRCDTHKDNRSMRRNLEKLGFDYRGVIRLANGAPRVAYEKEFCVK